MLVSPEVTNVNRRKNKLMSLSSLVDPAENPDIARHQGSSGRK